MSWHSWTEDGYGIPLGDIEHVKKFLIKREKDKDIVANLKRVDDFSEIEDIYGDPAAWVVAGIIKHETGYDSLIGFMCCGDTNFEDHLGFTPQFPWALKEKDKGLTIDKADKILKKYARELGVDEEPDYFMAEYCG